MKICAVLFAAVLGFAAGCAAHSPYADLESRAIKALSAEETENYLSGKGMALALAAELNGYPGPLHVLEFADELELSETQREKTARLFAAMQKEARALGAKIVAKEKELDALFSQKLADEESLRRTTAAVAALKGELRFTHLKYHLKTIPVLNGGQIAKYGGLRGYHRRH